MVDVGIYPGFPPEPDLRPAHYHPSVPTPAASSVSSNGGGYSNMNGYSNGYHQPSSSYSGPVPVPPASHTPTPPNGHSAHAPHTAHTPHAPNGNSRNLPPIPVPMPTPAVPQYSTTPPSSVLSTSAPAPSTARPPPPQAPTLRHHSTDTNIGPYSEPYNNPHLNDVPVMQSSSYTAEPNSILQQSRPQPQPPQSVRRKQSSFPPPQARQMSVPPTTPPESSSRVPPPKAPSTQVSFSESVVSDASRSSAVSDGPPRSTVSFSTPVPAESPTINGSSPVVSSPLAAPPVTAAPADPGPAAKPWVHSPTRVYFLPPATAGRQPPALHLLEDALEAVKDYREFVDTVGRLEYEYGKALSSAIKKFDQRLDTVATPPPGGRKAPVPSLVTAMRAHLDQLQTQAALHQKRPGALGSQLVAPLQNLEKRGNESARRLTLYAKEIKGRWEAGRERVEIAKVKYHTAVREDETAQQKLRACPPPAEGTKESDWVKLERAAAEADAARADRKRAYLVALAGEGDMGGGGWDRSEGGGPQGWGEEARQLYGHVEQSLLELLRHHAHEDVTHMEMLRTVLVRAEKCYANVSVAADEDAFLEWSDTGKPTERIPEGGLHSSLRSHQWVPPPSEKNEPPVLGTDKQADRNWLVNKWLQASAQLLEVEGDPEVSNKGPLETRRKQLATIRKECVRYSSNRGLGDADEAWERRVALLRELGVEERKAAVLHAEMACLEAVLGPTPAPELVHDFKDRAFAAPQPCDVCGQAVWSPLKSELACRLCSIALHVKCALLVDPECTGLKNTRRRTFTPAGGRIRRSITSGAFKLRRHSYETSHGAPQPLKPAKTGRLEPLRDDEVMVSPFMPSVPAAEQPAVAAVIAEASSEEPPRITLARVRFDYAGENSADLSVLEGEVVRITEPDLDGSGWVKARKGLDVGQDGLVPLAYVGTVGSSTPPLDGGGGKFVHALFDFPPASHHLGPGEVRVKQHEIYELSTEGMAFDHAWAELLVPHPAAGTRIKGVVPKNYIQAI